MAVEESKTATDEEAVALLRQRALQFLVHSFLYYKLDEPIVGDQFFDQLATDLKNLRERHPTAEMPHADLIEPQLGAEASAFRIKQYPPRIVSTAFKLLYAANNPTMDFVEFAEKRGYSTLLETP